MESEALLNTIIDGRTPYSTEAHIGVRVSAKKYEDNKWRIEWEYSAGHEVRLDYKKLRFKPNKPRHFTVSSIPIPPKKLSKKPLARFFSSIYQQIGDGTKEAKKVPIIIDDLPRDREGADIRSFPLTQWHRFPVKIDDETFALGELMPVFYRAAGLEVDQIGAGEGMLERGRGCYTLLALNEGEPYLSHADLKDCCTPHSSAKTRALDPKHRRVLEAFDETEFNDLTKLSLMEVTLQQQLKVASRSRWPKIRAEITAGDYLLLCMVLPRKADGSYELGRVNFNEKAPFDYGNPKTALWLSLPIVDETEELNATLFQWPYRPSLGPTVFISADAKLDKSQHAFLLGYFTRACWLCCLNLHEAVLSLRARLSEEQRSALLPNLQFAAYDIFQPEWRLAPGNANQYILEEFAHKLQRILQGKSGNKLTNLLRKHHGGPFDEPSETGISALQVALTEMADKHTLPGFIDDLGEHFSDTAKDFIRSMYSK